MERKSERERESGELVLLLVVRLTPNKKKVEREVKKEKKTKSG